MTKTLQERSAGVVIYRMIRGQAKKGKTDSDGDYNNSNNQHDSRRAYLILEYPAGHWDFAKGKKEKGETDMQTAIREVREETGITDLSIRDGFQRRIEYEFMDKNGTMIHKTVIFYVGRTETKEIILSDEHRGHAWLEYDDASFRTTYAAARNVLAAADAVLDDDDCNKSHLQ